jgi:subtilisin family serine protease
MFPNNNIIMRVAEVDLTGKLAPHSNFGRRAVQIAAICQNYTTFVFNGLSTYEPVVGTSNSAPVVSGVSALMLSVRPDLKAAQLKRILMDSAHRLPELEARAASGCSIDARAAVAAALSYPKAASR